MVHLMVPTEITRLCSWNTIKPRAVLALTDTFIKQVKHSGKPAGDKHTDGQVLYLLVKATGFET
jgi:hypothetical protein